MAKQINGFGGDSVIIAWIVSKYEIFSGPYFPATELNTEIYGEILSISSYSVRMPGNTDQKKYVFGQAVVIIADQYLFCLLRNNPLLTHEVAIMFYRSF